MQLRKEEDFLHDFQRASQDEWLETNGLGGWASSSIIGCNTRRYHGLLVAAIVPPAERMSVLSKMDETLVLNDSRFELGVNDFGDNIHPQGHQFQVSFSKELFPEFIFEVGGIRLKKTITMVQGENTTLVIYEVLKAEQPFNLELLPFFSVRGYHSLMHANDAVQKNAEFSNDVFRARLYDGTPEIFIKIPGAIYQPGPNWWFNFNYQLEKYRGLDHVEDLFTYGKFSVGLTEGDSLGIIISTQDPATRNAKPLFAAESFRKHRLLSEHTSNETLQQLILAADQFIVRRGENLKTVIAGYHWFADWGRDTMISLPGLCLSTGRFEDAKRILTAFAESVSEGMLPNRFQDNGEAPEYNNVDGTLWYFVAVYKYLHASGDMKFVLTDLLPVLRDIINWHHSGTRYHIHDEEDGLLYSGEAGVQLTWMDSKVGDWVVTPRTGKAVEVNALWYNALNIYAELLELNQELDKAGQLREKANFVRANFNKLFWSSKGDRLYDVVNGTEYDEKFRPNQLFAISLPFPLVEGDNARKILASITNELYTPVGLRTLPLSDPSYVGKYGGDAMHRDSAYHQGTVWSWLLGAYVDALAKIGASKSELKKVIDNFSYHLNEACIGSVSEIFDADAPHHPRGCVAQAWGVAEVLRVIKEYGLVDETVGDSPSTVAAREELAI